MEQLAALSCAGGGGQLAFVQGVTVPNCPHRPQPKAKLSIPLPKVQFEDIAAKAGLGKATSLERIEEIWPGGKKRGSQD